MTRASSGPNLKAQKKAAEEAAAEAAVTMGAGDLQAKKDAKAEGSYLDQVQYLVLPLEK